MEHCRLSGCGISPGIAHCVPERSRTGTLVFWSGTSGAHQPAGFNVARILPTSGMFWASVSVDAQ